MLIQASIRCVFIKTVIYEDQLNELYKEALDPTNAPNYYEHFKYYF